MLKDRKHAETLNLGQVAPQLMNGGQRSAGKELKRNQG